MNKKLPAPKELMEKQPQCKATFMAGKESEGLQEEIDPEAFSKFLP